MPRKSAPGNQLSIVSAVLGERAQPTARWEFLREVEALLPWPDLEARAERARPPAGAGRQPYPLEPLIRLWLVGEWFELSARSAVDLMVDSEAVRAFCRLDAWRQKPPGASTLQRFDRELRSGGHADHLRGAVALALAEHGYQLREGCVVEPALVPAHRQRPPAVRPSRGSTPEQTRAEDDGRP
ncbi:MAG TPA: transposase [Gammaproteobacteria bacterium]|nr:transposase [Gammaproteobacteria bacterium]